MDNEGFQPSPPPLIGQDGLPAHDPAERARKKRGGRRGPRPLWRDNIKPRNGRRKKQQRAELPQIESAGLRHAKLRGNKRVSSVTQVRLNKPHGIQIDLPAAMAACAGLDSEQVATVLQLLDQLQPHAPKQRGRIVAALARLVG